MIVLSTILYIAAAAGFIFGLKLLSNAKTARRGNAISAAAMGAAVIGTLLQLIGEQSPAGFFAGGMSASYPWIILGVAIGAIVGIPAARLVKMTAMPEMVALFNGFGGIASMLIGLGQIVFIQSTASLVKDAGTAMNAAGEVTGTAPPVDLVARSDEVFFDLLAQTGGSDAHFTAATIAIAVLIGGLTFTGSIIAWGKLSEKLTSKALTYTGQNLVNGLAALAALVCVGIVAIDPTQVWALYALAALALLLGVAAVIPIGGADMPVVIALLNSYSGLAACAAGFAIGNLLLIVTGALVGASGLILTNIMCVAMNRSLANVLFSGFGSASSSGGTAVEGEAKPMSPQEAYLVLEAARSVIFVPGYGMAVAQAQHIVRELANLLESNGTEVKFAIHPVAGRMPGHMSVLLAEADVSYDLLVEPDDVNPSMEMIDVTVVIGANDVVNPAAREDEHSPLYGMPIIDVDRARTCLVLKRSMRSGYAGVENPLFFKDNTRMVFGDAKKTIEAVVAEFKDG